MNSFISALPTIAIVAASSVTLPAKTPKTADTNVNAQILTMRVRAFAAYLEAEKKNASTFSKPIKLEGNQVKGSKYKIDDKYTMPYVVHEKGAKPKDGWPLIIAMHGGGGTNKKLDHPHAWSVNSREWNAQLSLSAKQYPNNAIYFVPRMVDDNNGRWWRDFNVTAFNAMIKHAIAHWDVNPNRVYILGISEGGYGTEVLASWMPEKFAAANGMACGSNTSVRVENLRNVPFRTDVGEHDTAFGRIKNVRTRHKLLGELRTKDPQGYLNSINVQAGRGHRIKYSDGPAWVMQHTRNPHPERVVYYGSRNDKAFRHGAYWLEVKSDLGRKHSFLEATSKENVISISAKVTKSDGPYQSPEWQAPLKDQGELIEASGTELRIWLHEKLIDFSKPVTVKINGKEQQVKVKPSAEALKASIQKFGDPNYAYPAFIDVTVK